MINCSFPDHVCINRKISFQHILEFLRRYFVFLARERYLIGKRGAVFHFIHNGIHIIEIKRLKSGIFAPVGYEHIVERISDRKSISFVQSPETAVKRFNTETELTRWSVVSRFPVLLKQKIRFDGGEGCIGRRTVCGRQAEIFQLSGIYHIDPVSCVDGAVSGIPEAGDNLLF